MFGRGWEAGKAKIIARKPLSAGPHGITTRWSYVGDVQPDDGGPGFRATFDDPHLNGELISPADGDVIVVKFHPKTHAVKIDRRDPALSSRKRERRERDEVQQRFDAAANAAPGVAAPSAASDAGSRLSSQVEARMDELERRYRSGELTEAQLKREQAKLIDEL
jgi:hypothetical protein